jgi:CheY-like chemotaxis protein
MALILVIDDDDTFLSFITWALKSDGHQCLTASNGLEAVAVYRSLATRIDLVITDLKMPVMDGLQTVLRIRMTRKDAKIICMRDYPEDRPPEQVFILEKPFSVKMLVSCVNQALHEHTEVTLEPQPRRL